MGTRRRLRRPGASSCPTRPRQGGTRSRRAGRGGKKDRPPRSRRCLQLMRRKMLLRPQQSLRRKLLLSKNLLRLLSCPSTPKANKHLGLSSKKKMGFFSKKKKKKKKKKS